MNLWLPGQLGVVNRSGETIPAASVGRIVGRDSTDTDLWELGKPNAADQRNICWVPEELANDRKGEAFLFNHPRIVNHSLGSAPDAGTFLGATSGAWTAAQGCTLMVWTADADQATVSLTGRPGGNWGPERIWTIADLTADPVEWGDLNLYHGVGDDGTMKEPAIGVKMVGSGLVTGLSLSWVDRMNHAAGVMDFRVRNKTQGDTDNSPEITNLAASTAQSASGGALAYAHDDVLVLQGRAANATSAVEVLVPATIIRA